MIRSFAYRATVRSMYDSAMHLAYRAGAAVASRARAASDHRDAVPTELMPSASPPVDR